MKTVIFGCKLLLGPTLLLGGALVIGGCNKSYPDEKAAVDQALTSSDFGTVGASQDRDKGVMTLTRQRRHIRPTRQERRRSPSEPRPTTPSPTKSACGPRTVPNAAGMDSKLDSAIEDQFKAQIKSHPNLDDQSISGSAKNGTLVIKGSVKTPQQKAEAETLAKQVPNVQQVVNELKVKSDKHSTPSS